MKNITSITIILIVIFIITSCLSFSKYEECKLTLKYEWKIPSKHLDIINMEDDRLIASRVYYKNGLEQYVKDEGHFIIDKLNGQKIGTVIGFMPKTAENKYLWRVGYTTKSKFFFETKISKYTIASNYKGYKIILQEWYKNIRRPNNTQNSVLVYKGNIKMSEYCLPQIFDFAYDESAVYINSDKEMYKFNFDEFIKDAKLEELKPKGS